MYRVTHGRNLHAFKVSGLKTLGEFMEPLHRHANLSRIRRALDWGCGCGRLTMFFLAAKDGPEVFGCDIDAEAIAWCNEFLEPAAFAVIEPMPPTAYPDAHFDLILSYSVFTHLTRQVQQAWLAEMYRVLAPGGFFLASTHGIFAHQFSSGSTSAQFPPEGIVDLLIDSTLGEIAPKDYYRATFQSKEYTLCEFGKYFQMVEYIERGANNFQDLAVMQKR